MLLVRPDVGTAQEVGPLAVQEAVPRLPADRRPSARQTTRLLEASRPTEPATGAASQWEHGLNGIHLVNITSYYQPVKYDLVAESFRCHKFYTDYDNVRNYYPDSYIQ